MKFTLNWLKYFLTTDKSIDEIREVLTMLGFEVESVEDRRSELKDFEIAEIVGVRDHPEIKKLKICDVKCNQGIIQIVCGASNVCNGLKVILANIGTIIPKTQLKIKELKIQGIKSHGMLCSESELLLGDKENIIVELPSDAIVGDKIFKYYGIGDPVFHINITPNRGDVLSVYGIARELAIKNIGILKKIPNNEIKEDFISTMKITFSEKSDIITFALREIKNIKNLQSPNWLKNQLSSVGINSINALVDITNYIACAYGQPLHIYDSKKILGDLKIKTLDSSEDFLALNGNKYILEAGDLVLIDDSQNIHSIPGIIGSELSKCTFDTDCILLEAASFLPNKISKIGRRLKINTDARYRFERIVDSNFTLQCLNIASDMIQSICGRGEFSQIFYYSIQNNEDKFIDFPYKSFKEITGLEISKHEIDSILLRLGFDIKDSNDYYLKLKVPVWRYDIKEKEDIVEEILRIYGYDKLEGHRIDSIEVRRKIIPTDYKRAIQIKRILSSLGYHEVISNSFMNSKVAKLFSNFNEDLLIVNPINIDSDYMRPSIIPNLLKILYKNLQRSVQNISLIEIGPVFHDIQLTGELLFASGIRSGFFEEKNCHSNGRLFDLFDIKSDLSLVLEYMNLSIEQCNFVKIDLPYYDSIKAAKLMLGSNLIGYFGQINSSILEFFGIEQNVFAFELSISNLPPEKRSYKKPSPFITSDFQASFRDYAFIVDFNQKVGEIINAVKSIDRKIIRSVELFDIYYGNKVLRGTKSIAIKVKFQSNNTTLNEEILIQLGKKIINLVETKFHGKLRSDFNC